MLMSSQSSQKLLSRVFFILLPIATMSFLPSSLKYGPQLIHDQFRENFINGQRQIEVMRIKTSFPVNSIKVSPLYASLEKSSDTSKSAQEFRSMMSDFEAFTNREIEYITNPRYRAMYYGVKAGSTEPNVYRAFEILYVDFVPIRVAGKMIFRYLKDVMAKSIERRIQEEEKIAEITGLDQVDIDDGRRAFMAIKANDDEFMTLDQLVDSGIINFIVELSDKTQTFDEFIAQLKLDKKGRLSFENFMIGLQQCTTDSVSPTCQLTSVLQEVEKKMGPIEAKNKEESVEKQKQKYSERFDNMLETFALWEEKQPSNEGRMWDVLKGCFDGAKNKDVVNALRIVYLDYSALRVAGDLVFKLVSKLVR